MIDSILFRVKLVERDHTPLGLALVDPDRSGKTSQYDLGRKNVLLIQRLHEYS